MKFLSQKNIQLLIIIVLTFLAYINILRNQFVIDDRAFVVDWQTKNSFSNIPKLLAGDVPPGHEGVYRPVRSLLYAIDYQIFGVSPFAYHLQAILIHLAGTVLVYLIVSEIVGKSSKGFSSLLPFVTALLFGLHPVHTETISYISSSVESVGLVFYFAAIWAYLFSKVQNSKLKVKSYFISVGLAGLAFFSTEMALSLPLALILVDLALLNRFVHIDRKSNSSIVIGRTSSSFSKGLTSLYWYIPFFTLAVVYLAIRFFFVHAIERGPYLADSVYLTFLTMTKVFVKYLSLLVMPINLANNHTISPGIEAFVYRDYRTAAISAQSILDPEILMAVGILGCLILLGILGVLGKLGRLGKVGGFCILWFFITLLPVSEIVPQGSMINEKFLYLASFGFVFLIAYVISLFKNRSLILAVVVTIAMGYGVRTYVRNLDWHDNIRLWSKDVAIYPKENAYAYFQLANAYAEVGAVDLAVSNYQKSFEINPNFVIALGSIAKTYDNVGKVDLAIDYYKNSLLVNPQFWEAHVDLAQIYFRRGDFDLAAGEYNEILAIAPQFDQVRTRLESSPKVTEATSGAKVADDTWLRYRNIAGLNVTVPSTWSLSRSQDGFSVKSRDGFEARFEVENKDPDQKMTDYLTANLNGSKKPDNEGKAFIPGFDEAWVRVWGDKLQFFLFKGNKVIQVTVNNANSPEMSEFNIVLGSIKFQ